jgi:hypothetical protein
VVGDSTGQPERLAAGLESHYHALGRNSKFVGGNRTVTPSSIADAFSGEPCRALDTVGATLANINGFPGGTHKPTFRAARCWALAPVWLARSCSANRVTSALPATWPK